MKNSRKHDNSNPHCALCEEAILDQMDALDVTGETAAPTAEVALHLATCAACSSLYAQAQRGRAWLGLLKTERPEPPAMLAHRILSMTSESPLNAITLQPVIAGAMAVPAVQKSSFFAAVRSILLQPQLAMTAAMAFLSISLTLNLTGVKLSDIHLADLRPSSLQHEFYQADAQVVRYYDNLRVVNDLESNVQKIQQISTNLNLTPATAQPAVATPDSTPVTPASPSNAPDTPKKAPGSSMRELPNKNRNTASLQYDSVSYMHDFAPFITPKRATLTLPNTFERNMA